MKAVILCGGFGTRFSEQTELKPKPMIEIGNLPMVLHIMKIYNLHGIKDFVLALGYKAEIIKEYFSNNKNNNWNISLVDTGNNTMTGGRVLRLKDYLKKEKDFLLTYGDGLANIDISKLIKFHKDHGKIGTVSAVIPSARFGAIKLDEDKVVGFKEKPQSGEGWINGGFFVFSNKVFDYIKNDKTVFEETPLENLAKNKELMAFKHRGYWQCMDTKRDHDLLQKEWDSGSPAWLKRL